MTPLARPDFLVAGNPFDIGGYIGLAGDSPGVLAMLERLRTNQPAMGKRGTRWHIEPGRAAIEGDGFHLSRGPRIRHGAARPPLAGSRWHWRAGLASCAPVLAQRCRSAGARLLLDVGGGTGLYSIALLQQNPGLRAIVWDRPEVLKVAGELADAHGVEDRLECRPGDMFADPVPAGVDVVAVFQRAARLGRAGMPRDCSGAVRERLPRVTADC